MDLNALVAFVKANPYAMFALGLAAANRRHLFRYAILAVLKTAWGRAVLLGNADEVLADFDDFRAELVQDLAEAKAAEAAKVAKAAPTPATADAPKE